MKRSSAGRAPVDKTTGRRLAIDRKELARYSDRKVREEARGRLRGLRQDVGDKRREKRERLNAVRDACHERAERTRREEAEARERMRAAQREHKLADREQCRATKALAREESDAAIETAKSAKTRLPQELKKRRAEVRENLRQAKQDKVGRMRAVKEQCGERVKSTAVEHRKATKAFQAAREARRKAEREECAANRALAKADAEAAIGTSKAELKDETREQRWDRVFVRAQSRKSKAKSGSAPKGQQRAERRQEEDDFAAQNIPAHLLALWEREKSRFKGPSHRRFEQFMEYVEAHPSEVLNAREEAAGAASERALEREFAEAQARHYGFELEPTQAPKRRATRSSAEQRTKGMFGPEVMYQRGRRAQLVDTPALRLTSPGARRGETDAQYDASQDDFSESLPF